MFTGPVKEKSGIGRGVDASMNIELSGAHVTGV
jgi:hypothetical protein